MRISNSGRPRIVDGYLNRVRNDERPEIVGGYRFMVELDGMYVAGFSEVSGLSVETQLEEISEGGLNGYVHRLPKQTKYQPLVLKRGITMTDDLWKWYLSVIEGKFIRKSGAVILFNELDMEMWRWNFYDAFPNKWTGPEFNASRSEIAVETIELVHNGIKAV